MKTPAQKRLQQRRLWLKLHLYLGLTLGLILAILGLTGTVIGFWEEIYEWTEPALVVPKSEQGYASLDKVLATIKATHPGRHKSWQLNMPRTEQSVLYALYTGPEEKGDAYAATLILAMDPNSGRIISTWYWGETWLSWFYNIHFMLDADRFGEKVVGISGLLAVFSALTGLYLWWPLGRFSKSTFVFNFRGGPARLEFDLHRLIGFYTLLLFLIVSVSGFMLTFPKQSAEVIRVVSPVEFPIKTFMSNTKNGPGISAMQAVTIAEQVFPGGELKRVYSPAGSDGVWQLAFSHDANTYDTPYRYSRVWIDQYSGQVLHSVDPTQFSAGEDLFSFRLLLHNGEVFGLPGRLFISVYGLFVVMLYITGVMQWWRRRKISQLQQAVS